MVIIEKRMVIKANNEFLEETHERKAERLAFWGFAETVTDAYRIAKAKETAFYKYIDLAGDLEPFNGNYDIYDEGWHLDCKEVSEKELFNLMMKEGKKVITVKIAVEDMVDDEHWTIFFRRTYERGELRSTLQSLKKEISDYIREDYTVRNFDCVGVFLNGIQAHIFDKEWVGCMGCGSVSSN